jgi:hypothetical protein
MVMDKDKEKKPKKKKDDDSKRTSFEIVEQFLTARYRLRLNEVKLQMEFAKSVRGILDWKKMVNIETFNYELYANGFTGFKGMVQSIIHGKPEHIVKTYNPIVEYYNNLPKWDGTDRIKKLCEYLILKNEEDKPLLEKHLRGAMVRTLALGMGIIKENKYCLIFQGGQDSGKTSFFHWLTPIDNTYFKKDFDPEKKEDLLCLTTKLLILFDEIDFNVRTIKKVKSTMSQQTVELRLWYDKELIEYKRNASFFGTTDNYEFLVDHVGNIRFIPFEIEKINHDFGGKNGFWSIDHVQMWSQIKDLIEAGERGRMDDDDKIFVKKNNRKYQMRDSALELVEKHIEEGDLFKTATDILIDLQDFYKNIRLDLTNVSIGRAMGSAGFERKRPSIDGIQVPGYFIQYKKNTPIYNVKKEEPTATEVIVLKEQNELAFQ